MRCSNEDNWIDRCRVLLKYLSLSPLYYLWFIICHLWSMRSNWRQCVFGKCVSWNLFYDSVVFPLHVWMMKWNRSKYVAAIVISIVGYFNRFWAMQINEISLVTRKLFDFMQIRNFHIKTCFYIMINAWRMLWSNILILLWIYIWFSCFCGRLL